MDILIDNTSIHSAGNMLVGTKAKLIDVDSLLQLCLQIIFSNKIYLTGLDLDDIKNKSHGVIRKLESLGLPPETITFGDYDINTLVNGCKEAALVCADDLRLFGVPEKDDLSAYGPELPVNFLQSETFFIDAICSNPKNINLSEIKESSLSKKANGAVDYMIADCSALREAFLYLRKRHGEISKNQLYQLTSFMRARLNQSIASSKNLIYSPSVTRARRVRLAVNFVLKELSSAVDNALITAFSLSSLEVPTLEKYLIIKSKGVPEKMLEEALCLREKTIALRSWIKAVVQPESDLTVFKMHQIRAAMKTVSEDLYESIKYRPATSKLQGVLDMLPILLNPKEYFPGERLAAWLRYNSSKKRLAALTEISLTTQYTQELVPEKNNLVEYAMYRR